MVELAPLTLRQVRSWVVRTIGAKLSLFLSVPTTRQYGTQQAFFKNSAGSRNFREVAQALSMPSV
jgi:hypothetical protein